MPNNVNNTKIPTFADLSKIAKINPKTKLEPWAKFQGKFVREKVKRMLETVAKTLPIKIDCGYRSLTEQYQRFGEQMGIYNDIEEAHKRIAEPSVAGHPTGGAVDIYLEGVSPKVGIFKNCAYNPKNKKQHMLHEAMTKVGFAPYNEEWWHFSYGDKDWASFYGKEECLYPQVANPYTYTVYSPAGNITALVDSLNFGQTIRESINREIQQYNPKIEQVGFINEKPPYRLEMAGGEFCANASRAAVYHWLKGNVGKIEFTCSGNKDILNGGITKDKSVYLQGIKITKTKVTDGVVAMQGITHHILPLCANKEVVAKKIINADKNSPCVGVVFYSKNKIIPCVYVRAVNTTYWESSCASGSIAFGIWNYKNNKSVNKLDIVQPSKSILSVNVAEDKTTYIAEISGKIKKA